MPQMLPIAEAAPRLGISVDAVRKKIRRGTITAEKRGDRWFVAVPDADATQDADYDAPSPRQDNAITHELVEALRAELAVKNRQIEQLAVLLGNAQQTVQLLTAGGADAPESSQRVVEEQSRRPVQGPDRAAPQGFRAWWRKVSGTG